MGSLKAKGRCAIHGVPVQQLISSVHLVRLKLLAPGTIRTFQRDKKIQGWGHSPLSTDTQTRISGYRHEVLTIGDFRGMIEGES